MNNRVILEIAGLHTTSSDNDAVEMIHSGEYYFRNGKHYVKYQESLESGELCDNMLKISPKQVEFQKKGAVSTNMIFTVGEKNITCYETPFGTLTMGVDTHDLVIKETEDSLLVDIDYALDINYDVMSTAHVTIKINNAM